MKTQAPPYVIRPARISEAARLTAFETRCFTEAFGADNTPGDVAAHIASHFTAEAQEREILSESMRTLVVEAEGEFIAYSLIRSVPPPAAIIGPAPIELERIYVASLWHGRGVAQSLMEATLEAARSLGGSTVWLSVWERNPRAVAFYKKMGFIEVGRGYFWVGSDRQNDILVARSIAGTSNPERD